MALPKDGKPITEFTNQDVGLLDVANGIRRLATMPSASSLEYKSLPDDEVRGISPPVSRYRAKRDFDKIDKMDFIDRAFGEIYRFFEASIAELGGVENIECRLSQLREDHFSCTIINRGIGRGVETLHVRKGGSFSAIDILFGEKNSTNTSNGGFSVGSDEYQLFLRPTMFHAYENDRMRLSAVEAAKMLWDDVLARVGIDYA
jgi:hypothetical protein